LGVPGNADCIRKIGRRKITKMFLKLFESVLYELLLLEVEKGKSRGVKD